MSEQPATAGVPTWDLADRMRKSLRQSGVSVQEMADYLNVSPKSVSNWCIRRWSFGLAGRGQDLCL